MSDVVMTGAIPKPAQAGDHAVQLRRAGVVAVLVAVGYYVTAKIGFAFALQPGSVSTLWMPNSILLAGLLLVPRRFWWIILVASCPAHFASEFQSGVPTAMILSWFISNSFQALFGAFFICRFVDDGVRFDKLGDLTIFLLFGAFLAPFLSSFLDVALVKLNGWGASSFWEIWRVRCLSNILATLTLAPVIVNGVTEDFTAIRKASGWRYLEAALLTASLFIVGFSVFSSQHTLVEKTPSLLYWPLPFLLWAAVRFGPQGVSLSLLLVMFLAIGGATRGQGPFVANSAAANAMSIQWFLIVVSIPLMALAAVIQERGRAERSARQNEEHLAMAMSAAQMGTWEWNMGDNTAKWSDETKRIFGRSPSEPEVSNSEFYSWIHPEDRLMVERAIDRSVNEGFPYEAEFRLLRPDGTHRWVRGKGEVLRDEFGRPLRMLGLNADITERKRAEQALLESNERNQAILRALPDLMFLQTKEGVYLDYYARDKKDLMVPPESFLGKSIRDVMPSELAERVMECIGRLDGSVETQVMEYSLKIADQERYYEARMVSAKGDKVLSIVRDVTESRRAADALRLSEEKLLQSNRESRELAARLMTAQESERRRIALLLHDDLSQNIAAMGVAISRLKRKPPSSSDQMAAELDQLSGQTNGLTTQLRRLSHQLHPDVLEHVGLVAALESEVAEFGHKEQIKVEFRSAIRSEHVPLEVSACLYRVALEALRNVSRHSGALSASVALAEDDTCFRLEVADSGRGFDVEKVKRGSGLGLISAEERVKLLHGNFRVTSGTEGGTVLVAQIPVTRGS
jgi:PAS domain S-box-containing protein